MKNLDNNDEEDDDELEPSSYYASDEEIEEWAEEFYTEGLTFLRCRLGATKEESEDIVGQYFASPASRDRMTGRIEIVDGALFYYRLKQTASAYYAILRTQKRGGRATRLSVDDPTFREIAADNSCQIDATLNENFKLWQHQYRSVRKKCSSQEKLVLAKMLKMMAKGLVIKEELLRQFSPKQIQFIMLRHGKVVPYTHDSFRKKVQRLRRQIEAKVRKQASLN